MTKSIASLFLLIFVGCGVYLPRTIDTPLISKKKDLRVDAGFSLAQSAGNVTASYGLTKNIAVQAFGSLGSEQRYFYHGAVGYFKKLENRNVLEVYVGIGDGYGSASNHDTQNEISGKYQLYFGQFNYGKLGGESSIWDFGFGFKSGLLHSNLTKISSDNEDPTSQLTEVVIDNNLLIEPNVFVRIGDQHLKLSIKISGVFIPDVYNSTNNATQFPLNIGLGLNYRL